MSAKPSGFAQAPRAPAPREPASRREERRPPRGSTNAPGSGRRADGGETALFGSVAGAARAGWRRSTRRPTLGALMRAPRGLQPGKHRTAPSPWTVTPTGSPVRVRARRHSAGSPARGLPSGRSCRRPSPNSSSELERLGVQRSALLREAPAQPSGSAPSRPPGGRSGAGGACPPPGGPARGSGFACGSWPCGRQPGQPGPPGSWSEHLRRTGPSVPGASAKRMDPEDPITAPIS